jgi:hypothetical protein
MRLFFTLFILGSVLLVAGCAGAPRASTVEPTAEVAVTPSEATWQDGSSRAEGRSTAGQYPIAPGVWYPGDGPLPDHPFKYYRLRCWPGCHDPNSAPQPHP